MPIMTRGGHEFASSFAAAKKRLIARARKAGKNIEDEDAYTAGSLDRIAGKKWRTDERDEESASHERKPGDKKEDVLEGAAHKRVVKRMARWRNKHA